MSAEREPAEKKDAEQEIGPQEDEASESEASPRRGQRRRRKLAGLLDEERATSGEMDLMQEERGFLQRFVLGAKRLSGSEGVLTLRDRVAEAILTIVALAFIVAPRLLDLSERRGNAPRP